MPKPPAFPAAPFGPDGAPQYDAVNSPLKPILDALHFLLRLTLVDAPANARVLCVGVGTGADILALADANPGWSFTGVDPSPDMLAVAHRRLDEAGVIDRCQLLTGYASDVPDRGFDIAVSLLVAHFVKREDREPFYAAIHDRLAPGGRFASAEICADFAAPDFPVAMHLWNQVQLARGADPQSLEELPGILRERLGVIPPDETPPLLRDAGFVDVAPFFQASLIHGWHARKRATLKD
jgi:tRNA (cmo5U34)-methyltransferase